jgi:hypothetical protein
LFCVFAGGRLATAVEPTLISSDWTTADETPATTVSATIDSATITDQAPGDQVPGCHSLDNNADCCDCNLCCGCFGYCPTWDVVVGALYLHRSRPDPTAILTAPTGTPATVLNGSNFRFGWDAGPDIMVRRRMNSGIIWEGRYFNDRGASAFYNIPSITTFRVAGIGVTILGGGGLNNRYTTTLDSTELNALAPISSRFAIIGGIRAIYVRDTLGVNLAGSSLNIARWDDGNQLFGGQTGISANLSNPGDRLQITGWLKAGVYNNSADNTFRSQIVASNRNSADATSFVGDANIAAAYWITPHIALRSGYQILWLDRLALATEAAPRTTQVVGGTNSPANTNGQLLYHGATAAVEIAW